MVVPPVPIVVSYQNATPQIKSNKHPFGFINQGLILQATAPWQVGLLPRRLPVRVRTIDTGGAGPVSGLLEAVRMVKAGHGGGMEAGFCWFYSWSKLGMIRTYL